MPNGYNFIFRDLVTHEDDFVGMVAYSLYKRQKIEWIAKFRVDNNRDPSDDEVENGFSKVSNLPSQIQWYKGEAVSLLDNFLDEALALKLEEERQIILHGELVKAVSKGWIRSIVENTAAGLVASLLTIAVTGLIWVAAKGPENLMREALSNYLKPLPEQTKQLP